MLVLALALSSCGGGAHHYGAAASGDSRTVASGHTSTDMSLPSAKTAFEGACSQISADNSQLNLDTNDGGNPGGAPGPTAPLPTVEQDFATVERDIVALDQVENHITVTQQETNDYGWTTRDFDPGPVAKVVSDIRYHDVSTSTLQQDLNSAGSEISDITTFCGNAEANGQ